MGTTFGATTTSASAPTGYEEGEVVLRFEGVEAKYIKSKFGADAIGEDGKPLPNSFVWAFTVCDDDKKPVYIDGEPLEVEKVTSMNTNVKSKTVPGAITILKALMTADEYEAFEAGESTVDEDELKGRFAKGELFAKENGWPGIDDIRRLKGKGGAKAAA